MDLPFTLLFPMHLWKPHTFIIAIILPLFHFRRHHRIHRPHVRLDNISHRIRSAICYTRYKTIVQRENRCEVSSARKNKHMDVYSCNSLLGRKCLPRMVVEHATVICDVSLVRHPSMRPETDRGDDASECIH